MALIDFKVLPGIDKQNTDSGAEFRWVDSDNVRFRYNLPEKVGINLATGTVNVISWNPIVPGATGTWVPIDPNNP